MSDVPDIAAVTPELRRFLRRRLPERKDMNLRTPNRAFMRPRKRLIRLAVGAAAVGTCLLALVALPADAAPPTLVRQAL